MKRGQIVVQQLEPVFKIQANLDVEDSVFLTQLLFEYVSQGKITFELSSKKGSIVTEFVVSVVGGVISSILYDLVKKIYSKLKEEKKNGKEINPVYIFLSDRQYILTGNDDDKLPEEK